MREAVRALVAARVLEVRRGNGTFVTSLEPRVLLEGIGGAVELLQGDTMLELTEVRRLFEPVRHRARRHPHLRRSSSPRSRAIWKRCALRPTMWSCSTSTTSHSTARWSPRPATRRCRRCWKASPAAPCARGYGAAWSTPTPPDRTVAEHEAIYTALAAGDAIQAQAAALMHITTTENWLRTRLPEER